MVWAAVLKLSCCAKFVAFSVSVVRTVLCIENTKNYTHNIRHVCTLQFFSVFDNMFAMWLLQQLLLLHGNCNVYLHAWCCYMLIASTIFKNPVYLTNYWLDSRDVVKTKTSSKSLTLENLQIMPKCSYKIFEKLSSLLQSGNFCIFMAVFILAYVISHLQIQQMKSTLNWSFSKPYCCSIQSLKTLDVQHIRILTLQLLPVLGNLKVDNT